LHRLDEQRPVSSQPSKDEVSRRVRYRGRVQGVGFRYTCAAIAKHYPLTGYVKNLADGSVELVVSGQPDSIRDFLADIAQAFAGNITDSTSEDISLSEPFRSFAVRH
jgi:acylphosphatase